jgi:hypothetical protein
VIFERQNEEPDRFLVSGFEMGNLFGIHCSCHSQIATAQISGCCNRAFANPISKAATLAPENI